MPISFTPNGDDINDVFKVISAGQGKPVEFNIYNRSGKLIFHTTDIAKGWDGTYKEVSQDQGIYQYMFIVAHSDGSQKCCKGNATLAR